MAVCPASGQDPSPAGAASGRSFGGLPPKARFGAYRIICYIYNISYRISVDLWASSALEGEKELAGMQEPKAERLLTPNGWESSMWEINREVSSSPNGWRSIPEGEHIYRG